MVKRVISATAFSRSGVSDWLIQRLTALILLSYVIFMVGFFLSYRPINFEIWHRLFTHPAMRFFNFLTLLSLLSHAWIGMWSVLTDYIKQAYLRGVIQIIIILGFLACFVWGIQIFWG